jgi:16S rRNA (adenine1518-N6/adenine1519-N6)-dimethyltransferase
MEPLPTSQLPRVDAEAFSRVVAAAFGQRRKTLRNALGTLLDAGAIAAAGVDPQARAETLANDAFVRLARQLSPAGSPGITRATG